MDEDRELLRAGDVARILKVSRSRIYQLLSNGDLPSVRVGGAIRIPRLAWEAWLEEQRDRALQSVRPR
jgi:excisionase family DNA binding protein